MNPTPQPPVAPAASQPAQPVRPIAPQARPLAPNLSHIPTVTTSKRPWAVIFAVFGTFIALIGTFILYSLNITTASQIKAEESKIVTLKSQINNPPLSETNNQIKRINSSLQGYKTALGKQDDYSLFLTELANVTPKDIKLDSLAVDEKGGIRLTGRGPTFESVGKARLAYVGWPFLTGTVLDSVGISDKDDVVVFNLSGTIKKELLRAETDDVASPTPVLSPGSNPSTSPATGL